MGTIERIYGAVVESDVSSVFAVTIVVVLGLSVLGRTPPFARLFGALERSGPALLTTLGVLGTFAGIFIGLLDFDVGRIDDSVPQLLAGLKISFATSILGMGAAVALKFFQAVTPQPESAEAEVTPELIHRTLKSINESVDAVGAQQTAALEEVRKAISADSDSSLLTQVQKLRTTVQDGQKELVEEFRVFAATMAENNSKALIEALEQVIRDFNTQLNEQFGENFKQLNQAVGALLAWQENYREHVEKLEERIERAVTAVQASEMALGKIVGHTERIPEALKAMEDVLAGLTSATEDLNSHLEAIAELKARALEAFPVIDENLKRLTDDLGASVKRTVELSDEVLEQQRSTYAHLLSGFGELLQSSNNSQAEFTRALSEAMNSMQNELTKAMDGHTRAIEVTAEEMQRQIADAWTKTQETVEKQVEALDSQLQGELNRALELLGRNLASLSEKFVSDYTPLTDRLREVVQ